jgi:hypothetical protein
MEKILNTRTNRMVTPGTQAYRNALKAGDLKQTPTPTPTPEESEPEQEIDEPEFDESKLQTKLVELSTDMIQQNLKKIVKSQKLSDHQMDLLIKKMLYQKLCFGEPIKPIKPKKKKKFKVIEPSSSELESD